MDATPDTGPTILYVDDEQQACKWFARMVSASYNVLTANSVEEAKAVLRDMHDRIGVVLTDFRMPGGDGTELLRFIDAEYSDIATILVTAYADKDLLIQAVNTGRVFKILEKPYQPEDVRRSLQEALALRQDRLLRTQRFMAIDETLAFLAHELNTPLAAISNFARGIRMRVDQTEPAPGHAARHRPGRRPRAGQRALLPVGAVDLPEFGAQRTRQVGSRIGAQQRGRPHPLAARHLSVHRGAARMGILPDRSGLPDPDAAQLRDAGAVVVDQQCAACAAAHRATAA